MPPVFAWVESSAFGRMRAAAHELNGFPPSVQEGMHRPWAVFELLAAEGCSLVHAVLHGRPAALLRAPLPNVAVAAVATQRGWTAAELPMAILFAAVRATCNGRLIDSSGRAVLVACPDALL